MSEQRYPEAFYLMAYQCDQGHREIIWNSRDGITPFAVPCRTCSEGGTMEHVDWHLDRYDPNYKPQPGERIFVDITLERAKEWRRKFVEKYWDHLEMPMKDHEFLGPMGKEGAMEYLVQEDMKDWGGHGPVCIELT